MRKISAWLSAVLLSKQNYVRPNCSREKNSGVQKQENGVPLVESLTSSLSSDGATRNECFTKLIPKKNRGKKILKCVFLLKLYLCIHVSKFMYY